MISNSTITNTTFDYNVTLLSVQDATIDKCLFKGLINNASITGNLTKCQFEGLSEGITIEGPLDNMTIQVDITPTSANYVLDSTVITSLIAINSLSIDTTTVPRLAETLHKECFVAINGSKKVFMVQLSTDDNTPSGVIIMWYGDVSNIPSGYAICDGGTYNGVTTPNLVDRFIKASATTVGPIDNTETEVEGGKRTNKIKLTTNHLPKHKHSLAGITIGEHSTDDVSVTNGSSVSIASGDGSFTPLNVSVGSENHSHTFGNGAETGDGDFANNAINIEPQAYALIFIMKL